MKKGKNYYLIVPSSNIYVKNKDNDGKTINYNVASNIFNKYGVPMEYQKVIVKISLKHCLAKELLTHSMYGVNEVPVTSILKKDHSLYLESLDNIIETKLSIYMADKVKQFYQSIIDNGLAVNYKNAVKEIYKYHCLNVENEELRKIKRNEYIH